MLEEKINSIEETLAHQDQQIEDLSKMVAGQWDIIDVLKKNLAEMQGKIERLEGEQSDAAGGTEGLSAIEQALIDKPPHY